MKTTVSKTCTLRMTKLWVTFSKTNCSEVESKDKRWPRDKILEARTKLITVVDSPVERTASTVTWLIFRVKRRSTPKKNTPIIMIIQSIVGTNTMTQSVHLQPWTAASSHPTNKRSLRRSRKSKSRRKSGCRRLIHSISSNSCLWFTSSPFAANKSDNSTSSWSSTRCRSRVPAFPSKLAFLCSWPWKLCFLLRILTWRSKTSQCSTSTKKCR